MSPPRLPRQRRPRGAWNDLHLAALHGSVQGVVALLSRGSLDINQRCPTGSTALMYGAGIGHSSIVRILLSKGADVSVVDNRGYTALLASAQGGHVVVVTMLVEAGADLQPTTSLCMTSLHLAAQGGHLETVKVLLKAGIDIQATTHEGATSLGLAAQNGHWEVATELIEAGAHLAANKSDGFAPLHVASNHGHLETTKVLVKHGADLQETVALGFTPLHLAADQGHSEVVTLLVEAGADVRAKTCEGGTPLYLAAQNQHLGALTALVKADADLEARTSQGTTPLLMAAEFGHSAVVRVLIDAGADCDARLPSGATPLYLAASGGHAAVVEALIGAGGNPNARLHDGSTPLYIAARWGELDVVRALLRAKANPLLVKTDHLNERTILPLDAAACSGRKEVVRELVQQLGIEGCGGLSDGVDALYMAAIGRHLDIMSILADAGVMDPIETLNASALLGFEAAVKFLLQQREKKGVDGVAYVNARDSVGQTPLFCAINNSECSPRVVRLLVDAGADTTSALRVTRTPVDEVLFHETPLDFTNRMICEEIVQQKDATEKQLHWLEGIRRLLLRVEAVHAVSFLWQNDGPVTSHAIEGTSEAKAASTSLEMTLPTLRRRARRRGILLGALFRCVLRSVCAMIPPCCLFLVCVTNSIALFRLPLLCTAYRAACTKVLHCRLGVFGSSATGTPISCGHLIPNFVLQKLAVFTLSVYLLLSSSFINRHSSSPRPTV